MAGGRHGASVAADGGASGQSAASDGDHRTVRRRVLRLGISFSDQTALTDQDIALLLLSPIGLACALVVASVVSSAPC